MINYLRVTGPDINNGLGVRCTLWIAGCTHHCEHCHNSWTWAYNQGKPLSQSLDEIRAFLNKSYINSAVDAYSISIKSSTSPVIL